MATYSTAVFPPSQLWDFAVRIYNDRAVEGACLRLQDRRGLDVNLVLFCVWAAASGRGRLSEEELEAALEASLVWQAEVVAPLRHVRRFLKNQPGPGDSRLGAELARGIAESELFSEHMEIQILTEILGRPATGSFDIQDRAEAAADNFTAYMLRMIGEIDMADREDALIIWQQAFPKARPRYTDLFRPLAAA
ncbi:MAG: TIGR02444 family protein [Alphaproteobacteria bacterium]|nr:MAG: TIGR02444 family protein [Alphaproteobacteria bacterium]